MSHAPGATRLVLAALTVRSTSGPAASEGPMRASRGARSLLFLAALALAAVSASADEPATEPGQEPAASDRGDWEFEWAAYAWATDIAGNETVHDVHIDVQPQLWNDILYNVNGGLMTAIEARYQRRWIVNLDLFGVLWSMDRESGPYPVGFGPRTFERQLRTVDATLSVPTRVGTLQVPIRFDPGVLRVQVPRVDTLIGPLDVKVDAGLVQARLAAGYRLLDVAALSLLGREPKDDPRRVSVDVLAGLRYWYLHTTVDVDSPPIDVPAFDVESSLGGGSVRVKTRIPTDAVAIPTVRLPNLEFPGTTFRGTHLHESEGVWWIDPILGLRTTVGLCDPAP